MVNQNEPGKKDEKALTFVSADFRRIMITDFAGVNPWQRGG
jgi:CheY-like chemotaxis protein